MYSHQKKGSGAGVILLSLVFTSAIILKEGLTSSARFYWLLCLTVPLMLITILWKRRHTTKD